MSISLPGLYKAADTLAADFQNKYLWFLGGQYVSLVLASAFLSLYPEYVIAGWIYFAFISLGLGCSFFLMAKKPEKSWYQFRALAESVKTRSWLFSVCGEPFFKYKSLAVAKADYVDDIAEILSANQHVRSTLTQFDADKLSITQSMIDLRQSTLSDRKKTYIKNRVDDQCRWYEQKASSNNTKSNIWSVLTVIVYISAAGIILHGLTTQPQNGFVISPSALLVAASSIIGWTQIKKFNELAAAYSLTAHEISLARIKLEDAKTEETFSSLIDEVELVFSREHTQWVARQQT